MRGAHQSTGLPVRSSCDPARVDRTDGLRSGSAATDAMIRREIEIDHTMRAWYMLVLAGLTATLAVAAPSMAMPVLFAEIAEDLRLSLVQV